MPIQEFGLTAADIRATVHNLKITTTTSPSTSQVEDNITFVAAQVQNEAQAVGISTGGLSDGDADYAVLKKAVIYKVTGELLIGRNRGDGDDGAYYIGEYEKLMDSIRLRPQRISDTDAGPNLAVWINGAPDYSSSPVTDDDGADYANTTSNRVASFWYGSSGKIISGDSL
jgi:hypothetical protein